MPSRRRFLAGSAALGMTGAATACSTGKDTSDADAAPPDARPSASAMPGTQPGERQLNFVVVVADDLGWGELGSYGQQVIRTPRLDALAAEGLRFTDAYASAPVCAPSRCSLLTGLHSGHATVREDPSGSGRQEALTERDFTFAEAVRSRGYRTGLIGKWGFGPERPDQPSHPNSRGFETFYGYLNHRHAEDNYPDYLWENGNREEIRENRGGARTVYAPDLFQQRTLDFLDAHKDEPFLLCLAPTVPHAPSQYPRLGPYADLDMTRPNKAHAAQVTSLDTLVGNVVDWLTAHGLAERTLILVTSDNGPHEEDGTDPDLFDGNGPLLGYKRNLYEGGIRVPLIAWSRGRVPAGTTDRPTPLIDLLPTLAELAGAPVPSDIDGLSFARLLLGGPDTAHVPRHDYLYFYRNHAGVTERANKVDRGRGRRLAEAVRRDNWKVVRFAPGQDRSVADSRWHVELYDLARDQGEQMDLAGWERPKEADELVRLMHKSWAGTYDRKPFGLTMKVTRRGGKFRVAATLSNGSSRPWTAVSLALEVPPHWEVRALDPVNADSIRVGRRISVRWTVTPAEGAERGLLTCRATAMHAGAAVTYSAEAVAQQGDSG